MTEQRLAALGCRWLSEERCAHAAAELAPRIAAAIAAGVDLLLIHGASAIVDRRDVIPAAIVAAGGEIEHFGMPVDPGNLLLLGQVGGEAGAGPAGLRPLAQGQRLRLGAGAAGRRAAGRHARDHADGRRRPPRRDPVAAAAARRGRAAPAAKPRRAKVPPGPRIAALLLAAGQSRRMGSNKLLAEIDGRPMVARTAQRLLSSRARPIVAVLGNQADRGRRRARQIAGRAGAQPRLRRRAVDLAEMRPRRAAADDIDGVIVCLGDMPLIAGRDLDRLIAAFNPLEGRAIVVPTRRGKRGNPVLWAKRFFPEMAELAGDVGAKHLIGEHAELVAEVEMDNDGVLVDIDTPDALAALRDKLTPMPIRLVNQRDAPI